MKNKKSVRLALLLIGSVIALLSGFIGVVAYFARQARSADLENMARTVHKFYREKNKIVLGSGVFDTAQFERQELRVNNMKDSVYKLLEDMNIPSKNRPTYSSSIYSALSSDSIKEYSKAVVFQVHHLHFDSDSIYYNGHPEKFTKWEFLKKLIVETKYNGDSIQHILWKRISKATSPPK